MQIPPLFLCPRHPAMKKYAPLVLSLLAAAARADSVVVFNEVHYHPGTQEPQREYIELHNQMAVDVDLSRWEITGRVNYTFPAGTVIPGHWIHHHVAADVNDGAFVRREPNLISLPSPHGAAGTALG